MKNMFFLASVLLCTSFNQVTAQVRPIKIVPGTYYQDSVITKYTGIWEWTNGTDTFTIALVKKKWNIDNYSVDALDGGYRYVKNGVEVVNTLHHVNFDINDDDDDVNVSALTSLKRSGNKIRFFFLDVLKNRKQGHINTVITPTGNTYSMAWEIEREELVFRLPNEPLVPAGWSVPTNIVLIKK